METSVTRMFCLFLWLLPYLWGCQGSLSGGLQSHQSPVGEGSVPVRILLEGGAASRTIAPAHVTQADLANPGQYQLVMEGTSDMGGRVQVRDFVLRNGQGFLALDPGAWTLTLTATEVASSREVLRGSTLLIVQDAPTSASITLGPVTTATGTVRVQFTLPQTVVRGLDPATSTSKTITVGLYDASGQLVAGTQQRLTANANDTTSTVTYTANGAVAAGQYTLRLTAPYTGANGAGKTLGWEDVLHVEGNRQSAAAVPLQASVLGKPTSSPGKKDKTGRSVTVARSGSTAGNSTANITTGNQTFNPYGEGLWIYGANWDGGSDKYNVGTGGNRGNTIGNEVLLVAWDAVYDADYYELELLLHPNFGQYDANSERVSNGAKYERLPVSDADWDSFKARNPAPLQLAFSGDVTSGNYYKTKFYTHNILTNGTARVSFDFLAWRSLANGKNGGYAAATAATTNGAGSFIGPPAGNGLSTRGGVSYRIGLEGDCNALAVLVNSFSPQHWYGIRLRAVNEFGYGDWVYWKGGKN